MLPPPANAVYKCAGLAPRPARGASYFQGASNLNIEPGLAYTMSNEYFERFADPYLMRNHESDRWGNGARPYFVAFQDKKEPSVYWAVPTSSNPGKFARALNEAIELRGYCDTLHFSDFGNRRDVWLIQNMCPITERYVSGLCSTKSGKPIMPYHRDAKEVARKAAKVLKLAQHGVRGLVYPDIERLYKGLLMDRAIEQAVEKAGGDRSAQQLFADAARRARERNESLQKRGGPPKRER